MSPVNEASPGKVPARVKKPARKAGPRQPERTRRNILRAATAEFAAKGLAGARVNEIADRARINKRMLYEYFGNKEALYLMVLERAYEAMRGEERLLDFGAMAPAEGMRRLAEFNFDYCSRHPEFIALLNGENLHRAKYVKRSSRIRELYFPLLSIMEALLHRGAEEGVFREGVDPIQLYITMASLSYFYFSNIHTLSAIFGRDLHAAKAVRRRREQVVEVVLGYLRPRPPSAATAAGGKR